MSNFGPGPDDMLDIFLYPHISDELIEITRKYVWINNGTVPWIVWDVGIYYE